MILEELLAMTEDSKLEKEFEKLSLHARDLSTAAYKVTKKASESGKKEDHEAAIKAHSDAADAQAKKSAFKNKHKIGSPFLQDENKEGFRHDQMVMGHRRKAAAD